MKKLFLIFNVMLIFLITTIGRVKAYEEPVGYFFGKEYPIINNDPNVMPLYDVSGYEINAYIDDVFYNQAFSTSAGNHNFILNITLPETIDVNKSINIYVEGMLNGINSFDYSPEIALRNPNGSYYSYLNGSGTILTNGGIAYGWQLEGSAFCSEATTHIALTFDMNTQSGGSFYITSITISEQSTDGLISSIASVLAELVPYIMNIDKNIASILTWMQPILNAINSGTSSIVSSINSMSNAIQSDLNSINSSIDSMNTNLGTKIDSMKTTLNSAIVTMMNTLNNSLKDLLGENEDTTNATNENDSTTSNFESVSGQYDDIEHSAVEDFENNLANVDTDTDLLNVADFKSTSNFIATNLTNIYNSHDYIGNMIIFSLVIGFSLTLIGIKVRR